MPEQAGDADDDRAPADRQPDKRANRFRPSCQGLVARHRRQGAADRDRPQQEQGARQREEDRDPLGPVLVGIDRMREGDVQGEEGDVGDEEPLQPEERIGPPPSPRSRRFMDLASRDPARRFRGRLGFFLLAEIGGRLLELGQLGDDLVVAMPLDEVSPSHVGAVLGRPAAVVPEFEVKVLDRLVEGLVREAACPCAAYP